MRSSVHAVREAAHDDEATVGDPAGDLPRHVLAVRRRGARPDDRDRTPLELAQQELDRLLDLAMNRKPQRHNFAIDQRGAIPAVDRHMSVTGG